MIQMLLSRNKKLLIPRSEQLFFILFQIIATLLFDLYLLMLYYQVKLREALVSGLQLQSTGDFQVAWVDGIMAKGRDGYEPENGNSNLIDMDGCANLHRLSAFSICFYKFFVLPRLIFELHIPLVSFITVVAVIFIIIIVIIIIIGES